MSNDADKMQVFIVAVIMVFSLIYLFGYISSAASYSHNTYECTIRCDGRHSIKNKVDGEDVCFCRLDKKDKTIMPFSY